MSPNNYGGKSLDDMLAELRNNMGTSPVQDELDRMKREYEEALSTFDLRSNRDNLLSGFDLVTSRKAEEGFDKSAFSKAAPSAVAVPNGIIFTDTWRIARNYACAQQDVVQIIKNYIQASQAYGEHWHLVDMGDAATVGSFKRSLEWRDYSKFLDNYCASKGWKTTIKTALLIIGDVEIIPQHREIQTAGNGNNNIEVDTCYALPNQMSARDYVDMVLKQRVNNPILCRQLIEEIKFNVSRLPVISIAGDGAFPAKLKAYFDRCIQAKGNIPMGKISITTQRSWLPECQTALVPLRSISTNPYIYTEGVHTSPDLDITKRDEVYQRFRNDIRKADFQFYDLHGDCAMDFPFFLAEIDPEKKDSDCLIALEPDIIKEDGAPLIGTLACFGARYNKYPTALSMMLTALNNKTLLYYGSSVVAYCTNNIQEGTEAVALTKIFHHLMLHCDTVGEAFMRAKIEYLARIGGDAIYILYTFTEFNLYGNPLLHIVPCMPVTTAKSLDFGKQNLEEASEGLGEITTLYSRPEGGLDGLLAQVQNLVDSRLNEIAKKIFAELGDEFTTDRLQKITEDKVAGRVRSYTYTYCYGDQTRYFYNLVITDIYGNIKHIVHTK